MAAGIVVYNIDNHSILVGTESVYDDRQRLGYRRTLNDFINGLDALGIFGAVPVVRNNFIAKYDAVNGDGSALALLGIAGDMKPVLRANNPISFIHRYILDETFVNIPGERFHIVNNEENKGVGGAYISTSCRIRTPNGNEGVPKGGLRGGENNLDGALREFQEETGFDITTLPGYAVGPVLPAPGAIVNNQVYNSGNYNGYDMFFIQVNNADAQQILNIYYGTGGAAGAANTPDLVPGPVLAYPRAGGATGPAVPGAPPAPVWNKYPGGAAGAPSYRYSSELYNLRFVKTIPGNVNAVSRDAINDLVARGYIGFPAPPPPAGNRFDGLGSGRGGPRPSASSRFENLGSGRGMGAFGSSGDRARGRLNGGEPDYYQKYQKYINRLKK
jgi:hypothetical protein